MLLFDPKKKKKDSVTFDQKMEKKDSVTIWTVHNNTFWLILTQSYFMYLHFLLSTTYPHHQDK